ncbi:DUF262 domain-containing protein [Metabacillus idriensis]|uniref:GmrSD restriction endonuclease domain-containing protein n=1 Tax=Metabacillus idriensis TaxID=324768 RepID=UPI00174D7102|nr:DUF262 domain-containing protein [Metabacillus idriensis]
MNSRLISKEQEILNIFKENLKVEQRVMTVDTLFCNPRKRRSIKEDPYYQRNYVWDEDKASYFIESILLGTEVPPLIFFTNEIITEVIDGRQRFETIERFINNKFHLTNKGLSVLKDLKKKNFSDLNPDIQEILWDTTLRIIEFSTVKKAALNENTEDFIKKEIFRRYNSGITPLQKAEVDKAIYINNDVNSYFKEKIKSDKYIYRLLLDLFFVDRDKEIMNKESTLEKVMLKIRSLLVLHQIPIKYYASSSGREEVKKRLFDLLTENIVDEEEFHNQFVKKIEILDLIKTRFDQQKLYSNRLIFECLFWALNICEIEKLNIGQFKENDFIEKIVNYITENILDYTLENNHFTKETLQRHVTIAKFFEEEYKVSFNLYLFNSLFKEDAKELFNTVETDANKLTELESLRLNRPDATTTTIEDIMRQMMRKKFLLRPSYQRGEAINRVKSSSIIESILLGVQLPPIFIYKRLDGVSEVIDGQQRLLSILGFIGQSFMDDIGNIVYSEKNEYRLTKLKFFTDLNSKKFPDLEEGLKNAILEFNLSLVTVDAKTNPNFNPIDLFIRLNNKPFPIRDNTFEMWNSYIDKDIISYCKEKASKYSGWFYARLNNNRMENEELFIILSYMDYKYTYTDSIVDDYLDIYLQKDRINARIKDKGDITKYLEVAVENEDVKKSFIKSLKNTETFIKKIKSLLIDKTSEDLDDYLKKELESLLYLGGKTGVIRRRTLQSFYLLWYLLKDVNISRIVQNRIEMRKDIIDIFSLMKPNLEINENISKLTDVFNNKSQKFIKTFTPQKRNIQLNKEEKEYLIQKQDNTCPICNSMIFIYDDHEVDHITPLSLGGREGITNLQITHKTCNRSKGNRIK